MNKNKVKHILVLSAWNAEFKEKLQF